jgi:hypothetical protein
MVIILYFAWTSCFLYESKVKGREGSQIRRRKKRGFLQIYCIYLWQGTRLRGEMTVESERERKAQTGKGKEEKKGRKIGRKQNLRERGRDREMEMDREESKTWERGIEKCRERKRIWRRRERRKGKGGMIEGWEKNDRGRWKKCRKRNFNTERKRVRQRKKKRMIRIMEDCWK